METVFNNPNRFSNKNNLAYLDYVNLSELNPILIM